MARICFIRHLIAWLFILFMPCSLIAENSAQPTTSNISKQLSLTHQKMQNEISSNKNEIIKLQKKLEASNLKIDSLEEKIRDLKKEVQTTQTNTESKIEATNSSILSLDSSIKNKSILGCIVLGFVSIILLCIILKLRKKLSLTTVSVEETRNAQKELQDSQQQLENGTVSLDSKVADLLNTHLSSSLQATQLDHSLALKVADEIVRIETNLYRMDPATRGYKQLTRSVQRMKDCFMTKGYEISDLLGKPYNEGMKVVANFIIDDTLKEGEAIITGVTKPQIIYNGKMIQAAQITVSQNA